MTTQEPADIHRLASGRSLAKWRGAESEAGQALGNHRRDRLRALLEIEVALQAADRRHKDLRDRCQRYVKIEVVNILRNGPCPRSATDSDAAPSEILESIADQIAVLEHLCRKLLKARDVTTREDAPHTDPECAEPSLRWPPSRPRGKRHARAA